MEKQIFNTTGITVVSDKDLEGVGSIRKDAVGNVYRWVKNGNATGSTASAGSAMCYEAGVVTSVIQPTTAQLAAGAGITQGDLIGQSYGWILCKGMASLATLSKAATASQAAYGGVWEAQNGSYILKDATISPLGGGFGGLYGASYSTGSASSDTRTTAALWINCRL